MPLASNISGEDHLLRTLIYGYPKTQKTWWACRAAEAGFNVLLLDGDDGSMIVRQLPMEARKRILVVDLTMENDRTVFGPFMAQFLRADNEFMWNEQEKRIVFDPKENCSHIKFGAKHLNPNDVVIIDSWKALSESTLFQYAKENKIDLSDAEKTEWAGYGFQGNFLNWVLARLHALKCHVIVIGHSTVYEKWDRRDKANPKLIEQRTQIISCTGPHAKKVASHFTDVLHFERLSSETVYIDTAGDKDRDGGSRLFPPGKHKWSDLPPAKFFEKLGATATGEPLFGAEWFAKGALKSRLNAAAKPQLVSAETTPEKPAAPGTTAPPIPNNGGFAARFAKKGG